MKLKKFINDNEYISSISIFFLYLIREKFYTYKNCENLLKSSLIKKSKYCSNECKLEYLKNHKFEKTQKYKETCLEKYGVENYSYLKTHVPLGYHLNKVIKCNQQGYRLIHIWEDEWNESTKEKLKLIFEGKEVIDFNQKLDHSWYNNLSCDFEELPPEIIIRDGLEMGLKLKIVGIWFILKIRR